MDRRIHLAVIATGVLALAACSSSSAVPQSDVESEIATQWEAQNGAAPDSVSCPSSLDGKVGTVIQCQVTTGELVIPVNVTVTSVDGGTVNFDIQSAN